MRRTLALLAALVFGAASAATAQARAIAVVRLVPHAKTPPTVYVHVSNLLDDPEWQEAWRNAFVIRVHWKVQLWQKNFLISTPQPAVEWDVYVQQVPGMDLFNYAEITTGGRRTISFTTLDSLKAYLAGDVEVPGPAQLSPGNYFYRVDARVDASTDNPLDPKSSSGGSSLAQWFVGVFSGGGPARDLPTVERAFKVP